MAVGADSCCSFGRSADIDRDYLVVHGGQLDATYISDCVLRTSYALLAAVVVIYKYWVARVCTGVAWIYSSWIASTGHGSDVPDVPTGTWLAGIQNSITDELDGALVWAGVVDYAYY
jgi:hypothetical protein